MCTQDIRVYSCSAIGCPSTINFNNVTPRVRGKYGRNARSSFKKTWDKLKSQAVPAGEVGADADDDDSPAKTPVKKSATKRSPVKKVGGDSIWNEKDSIKKRKLSGHPEIGDWDSIQGAGVGSGSSRTPSMPTEPCTPAPSHSPMPAKDAGQPRSSARRQKLWSYPDGPDHKIPDFLLTEDGRRNLRIYGYQLPIRTIYLCMQDRFRSEEAA